VVTSRNNNRETGDVAGDQARKTSKKTLRQNLRPNRNRHRRRGIRAKNPANPGNHHGGAEIANPNPGLPLPPLHRNQHRSLARVGSGASS